MEVKASSETVRAGQPFSIACIAPTGPGFHQQWLHPKTQARDVTRLTKNCNILGLEAAAASLVSSDRIAIFPCHFPPSGAELKLALNGSGPPRCGGGCGILGDLRWREGSRRWLQIVCQAQGGHVFITETTAERPAAAGEDVKVRDKRPQGEDGSSKEEEKDSKNIDPP